MKKDNLTDVIQALPKIPVNNTPTQPQVVATEDGRLVTLGNKK